MNAVDASTCKQTATLLRALLDRDSTLDAARRSSALALFVCEDYAASAAEYGRLVAADRADHDLRLNLAVALYRARRIVEAREQLEHLLRDDPDSAKAIYHLAMIQWTDGDKTPAMDLFHRARRLDPTVDNPSLIAPTVVLSPSAISIGLIRIDVLKHCRTPLVGHQISRLFTERPGPTRCAAQSWIAPNDPPLDTTRWMVAVVDPAPQSPP